VNSTLDETSSPGQRALVVRGGWDGHQPVETTDIFIPFLEQNGFEVRIEGSPHVYADADYLAGVDLILQTNTMAAIEREEFAGLNAAIVAGTGFGGWHGGIADSYRNTADYLQLVGGQFAAHPGKIAAERIGERSDNFVPHLIEMTPAAAHHPITEGIGDFELDTEQYWVLHDDYNDVLATTTQAARPGDPWNRRVTSPAIWTRQWGKGRIFVCTPGHLVEVVQNPNVRTIIERGLLWAARTAVR
jgi:type 1 glutamine amidotransferase